MSVKYDKFEKGKFDRFQFFTFCISITSIVLDKYFINRWVLLLNLIQSIKYSYHIAPNIKQNLKILIKKYDFDVGAK